jgi:restriction system protein
MARRRNKEFNHVMFLLVLLSIILIIPKPVLKNMFFASLILVELSIIAILGYFWLKNYLVKSKEICTDIETIDKMNGIDFEHYIRELYIKQGYIANTTNTSHDFGADIIAKKNNEKICIQAKRYNKNINVGISAVQEVIGSINYYKANKGIVITTSNFTKSAIQLSQKNNITLIDRTELQSMIFKTIKTKQHTLLKFIKFITEP